MSKRRRGGTSGDNNYKESMTNTEQECHCSKTSRYHHKDSTYQNHSVDRCWTEPTPDHEWREDFYKKHGKNLDLDSREKLEHSIQNLLTTERARLVERIRALHDFGYDATVGTEDAVKERCKHFNQALDQAIGISNNKEV
jgi:hypothetical protein